MREAIILAGGFGTRLRHVVSNVPKPMAPVAGRPFLEHLLDRLVAQGFSHVVLSTGHMHEKIEQHFGAGYKGLPLNYAYESQPLGTGGGMMNALRLCREQRVAVMNGDTLFCIDFNDLEACYRNHTTLLAMALRRMEDTSRYGSVCTDADGRVTAFVEKSAACGGGLINGGIYLLDRDLFAQCGFHDAAREPQGTTKKGRLGTAEGQTIAANVPPQAELLPPAFSFEKDLMEKQLHAFPFYAMACDGYFIDIGIPEDYRRAQQELH